MAKKLKPALFVAFADPADVPGAALPGLRREEENIRAALHDICELGSWDYLSGLQCTRGELVQQFKSDRVAIFHFGGHASPQSLLLPAEISGKQIVSGVLLEEFLALQKNLQLAFFNACSTRQWAAKLSASIPYVVATLCPVQDQMALDFASAFYAALAADSTIEEAFARASAAVTLQHEELKPATPRAEADPVLGRPEFARREIDTDADVSSATAFPWILCSNGKLNEDDASWTFSVAAHDPLIGLPLLDPADFTLPDRPCVTIKGHTEADAPLFFGRSAEIRVLYDWALSRSAAVPILLFHGQSGAGKSSLLRAGLLPRLRRNCAVEYRRRNLNLLDDLYGAIGGDTDEAVDAWLSHPTTSLIILDQLEEAITHNRGSAEEMRAFIERVCQIFSHRKPDSKARLLLSFRKEYLAEILGIFAPNHALDAPPLFERFWLDRLDSDGIVEVIEGPTRKKDLREKYNIKLEPGFAEFVAGRLNDPDSPIAVILQIVLNQLWDLAREQGGRPEYTYSRELWGKLSVLDNPLHGFYADQLSKFFTNGGQGWRDGLELDLLLEHTTELGTSQRRTFAELRDEYPQTEEAEMEQLIRRNKELYLLAEPARDSDGDDGTVPATVLAHDTLAPVIRRDFALSVSPGARTRRLLENRGREWVGKTKADTLDGADLRVVERGLSQMRAPKPEEDALLRASREKRRKRRQAWIMWPCAALAVVGAVFAVVQLRTQKINAIRSYEALSSENLKNNSLIALLESMEAAKEARGSVLLRLGGNQVSNAVQQNLLAALNGAREMGRYPINWKGIIAAKCGVALDGDGQLRFRSIGQSGATFDGKPLPNWFGGDLLANACDPATGRIVAVEPDGATRIWQNGNTRNLKIPALQNLNGLTAVALSSVGGKIAGVWGAGPIHVVDMDSGKVQQFASPVGDVLFIGFGGDGTLLGESGAKGVQVWSLETGKPPVPMEFYPNTARFLEFGANSKGVLVGAVVDDVPKNDVTRCTEVSLELLAGSEPGLARYDYACDTKLDEPLAIAISQDGSHLAVGREDGGTDVREIPAQPPEEGIFQEFAQPIKEMGKPGEMVLETAFSPDGRLLAASSGHISPEKTESSGVVRVWWLDLDHKQNPTAQSSVDDLLGMACARVRAYLGTPANERVNPAADDRLDLHALESECRAVPKTTDAN